MTFDHRYYYSNYIHQVYIEIMTLVEYINYILHVSTPDHFASLYSSNILQSYYIFCLIIYIILIFYTNCFNSFGMFHSSKIISRFLVRSMSVIICSIL